MTALAGQRVVLRPIEPRDRAPLRAIRSTPEVEARWRPLEDDFPFEHEPELTRLAVLLDEEVIGMVQFSEETDPDARHADLDIFLHPLHHGRGLGTEVMVTLGNHLLEERAHHRLTLATAPDNAQAIRCYEKAGFRQVGVMRASARDPATDTWHDEILMERVQLPDKG